MSAAEFHTPQIVIVENVKEFLQWALYPAWSAAMQALGYSLAPHVVDCADLGVPQNRERMFIVCTRSKSPLFLDLPKMPHSPASSFIDFDAGKWQPIEKPGRATATLNRVKNARAKFGERFLMPYYGSGSGLTGRSLNRPIGTVTTRDRWAIADGDRMRMINRNEVMASMSFPSGYHQPRTHKATVFMAGNAVPPLAMYEILTAVRHRA